MRYGFKALGLRALCKFNYSLIMSYDMNQTGQEPGSDDNPGGGLLYRPWDDSSLFRDDGISRVSRAGHGLSPRSLDRSREPGANPPQMR